MRRMWMLGTLVLAGCMTRAATPAPVVERHDTVVVTPAPAAVEPAPATPPGQDPNFVPPGQGGTPPGQAKKEAAMEESAAPPAMEEAAPAAEASSEGEKPAKPAKSKGKKKGKKK